MIFENRSAFLALTRRGVPGVISHFTTRLFGEAHFLRPASSIDFRAANLNSFGTLEEVLTNFLPAQSLGEIRSALIEANEFLNKFPTADRADLEFPERWNSGKNLQALLYTFVRLVKPGIVFETGTANGASALAISGALHANSFGHLYSFDIKHSEAPLVPPNLREKVSFVKSDATMNFLNQYAAGIEETAGPKIFLHDADHSYLGQQNDYEFALKNGFDYILSDDVDTSLAFCDFAAETGTVFFDAPKFIGLVESSKVRNRK
jgi:hypothetical protein